MKPRASEKTSGQMYKHEKCTYATFHAGFQMYKKSISGESMNTGTYHLCNGHHVSSLFSLIIVMLQVGKKDKSSKGIHMGSVLGPLFSLLYNINISYFGLAVEVN